MMNAKIAKFESGWIGLSLALSIDEIDRLIRRLQELKEDKIQHFHLRNDDFTSESGLADVEVTTIGSEEINNMSIE